MESKFLYGFSDSISDSFRGHIKTAASLNIYRIIQKATFFTVELVMLKVAATEGGLPYTAWQFFACLHVFYSF